MNEQHARDKGMRTPDELRALAQQVKVMLFTGKGSAKLQAMRNDVPDYQKYELYHCLAGSGMLEALEDFDTPSHDFEKLIDELLTNPIEPEL